jgi:hypothetical protein
MSALHLAPLPAAQDAAALELLDAAFAGGLSLPGLQQHYLLQDWRG